MAPRATSRCPSALPCPQSWGGCCGRGARTGRDGAARAGAATLPEMLKTQKRPFPLFFLQKRMEISQTAETPAAAVVTREKSLPRCAHPAAVGSRGGSRAVPCCAMLFCAVPCRAVLCQGAWAPADAPGQKRRALIRAVLAAGPGKVKSHVCRPGTKMQNKGAGEEGLPRAGERGGTAAQPGPARGAGGGEARPPLCRQQAGNAAAGEAGWQSCPGALWKLRGTEPQLPPHRFSQCFPPSTALPQLPAGRPACFTSRLGRNPPSHPGARGAGDASCPAGDSHQLAPRPSVTES